MGATVFDDYPLSTSWIESTGIRSFRCVFRRNCLGGERFLRSIPSLILNLCFGEPRSFNFVAVIRIVGSQRSLTMKPLDRKRPNGSMTMPQKMLKEMIEKKLFCGLGEL